MKKAILTGASGSIGSALVSLLERKGIKCLVLMRNGSLRDANVSESEFVKKAYCSLDELSSFDYSEKDFDCFFHLGWDKTSVLGRDDSYTQEKNIKFTLDAVELASRLGCKSFVGAGSQAEYGVQNAPLCCDTKVSPESGYGIAKYASGKLSMLLANQKGIKHCWARILSVYGENDANTTLISYLIDSFKNGITPQLTKCEQIWDYIYADDCALALYLIGEKGKNGVSYPIGNGDKKPLRTYVEMVRDAINPELEIAFGAKQYYPHQPMFLSADISQLTFDTGFKPQYTFEQGIRRALKLRKEQ